MKILCASCKTDEVSDHNEVCLFCLTEARPEDFVQGWAGYRRMVALAQKNGQQPTTIFSEVEAVMSYPLIGGVCGH